MKCIKCQGKTQVQDSRPRLNGYYRRRFCIKCGHSFSTMELDAAETDMPASMKLNRQIAAAEVSIQRARSAMNAAMQKLRGNI